MSSIPSNVALGDDRLVTDDDISSSDSQIEQIYVASDENVVSWSDHDDD